jgi:hypothetical protein
MNAFVQRQCGRGQWFAPTIVLATCLALATNCLAAWNVEQNVEIPSYAVAEATTTSLNIDTAVLMCEAADSGNILQLQIYLSTDGLLRPNGVPPERLKDDPRAEISIDDRSFAVRLLFSDEYVVLADAQQGMVPLLSDRLLDTMWAGKRMVLRFDLVAGLPGEPTAFDGEAVIELGPGGAAAVSAVRRCVDPPAARAGGLAFARP